MVNFYYTVNNFETQFLRILLFNTVQKISIDAQKADEEVRIGMK